MLGRNEEKHLKCQYEGTESQCPKSCNKCAIGIKTEGDLALVNNDVKSAIKFYKKALFIEPKFAEAWNNLANAYGKLNENNKALATFEKAISIDETYGRALFGKAISLRNLGKLEEAMSVCNAILNLYDDEDVKKFKKMLVELGIDENTKIYSLNQVIDLMTEKIDDILYEYSLFDSEGRVIVEHNLRNKQPYSSKIHNYFKIINKYNGVEKECYDSIIGSFFGAICLAIYYYDDTSNFLKQDSFDYLADHVNLENLDSATYSLLKNYNKEKEEKLWDSIYSYANYCFSVIKYLKTDKDVDLAIVDACESAYVAGILLGMKNHMHNNRVEIDRALIKLAESSKDYINPPPESAMCYSMRIPEETQLNFKCDGCGKTGSVSVYVGSEQSIISQYKELAQEFVKLGHKARFLCFCDVCAINKFPREGWRNNNFVFEFVANGNSEPVYSFPTTWEYKDFDYNLALLFLKGTNTVIELAAETNSKLNAENYVSKIKDIVGDVN